MCSVQWCHPQWPWSLRMTKVKAGDNVLPWKTIPMKFMFATTAVSHMFPPCVNLLNLADVCNLYFYVPDTNFNTHFVLSWNPPKTTSIFWQATMRWPLLDDGPPGALTVTTIDSCQSVNQSLSLDDGPQGALTVTTIDSCQSINQSINHCHLMMDRQVLWQWQQSTAVNQSITVTWRWITRCSDNDNNRQLSINQSITVTWCPPVQHQSGNVRNTAVNGRKSW